MPSALVRPIDLAPRDAAAGQHRGPGVGEVVAAGAGVDLGRAAELAHPDDQGRVEQARGSARSSISVDQPASSTPLSCLTALEVLLMRVPAERLAAVDARERHLDERHAPLDQPAGEQAALAEQVAAVGVAERGGLLVRG